MIFLCFSSKDRYSIAESIYYHLNNIGVPIWYDRKEILMGDNRNYKNFIEGVDACRYAIILLSPNSISSICANEEIDLIYPKYLNGNMYVFPVFYNIRACEVPEKYSWMLKLVYKELSISVDSRGLCNHVACKYLLDKLNGHTYQTFNDIKNLEDLFITKLISHYIQIDGHNFNARISLLYAGMLYLQSLSSLPFLCTKGMQYIFNETKLNLEIDLRETLIFERLFLLTINHIFP